MSAVVSDSLARDWARRLETKEAERTGLPIKDARKRVAGRLGLAAGTLENLSRDRLKGVRHWIYAALRDGIMAELKKEMAAHVRELEELEVGGGHPHSEEVRAALAVLQKITRTVNDETAG